jgi:hypothetical protein
VVNVLQSRAARPPAQRTDWYWKRRREEGWNRVLVFVRYDVTLDAVKALPRNTHDNADCGRKRDDGVPAMARQHADFTEGAMLTKVGGSLAAAGIAPQDTSWRWRTTHR